MVVLPGMLTTTTRISEVLPGATLLLVVAMAFLLAVVPESIAEESPAIEAQEKMTPKEDLKLPVNIQDLAYGHILFQYYRGKPIEALNAILVAQKRNALPSHSQSAKLLSGVIYLDLGMLTHAQQIFNQLLTEKDLKSELLARLEFYLGKLHYRQSDYQQALFRLRRIVASLNSTLKDEALLMLGNIALQNGDKQSARDWLNQIKKDSALTAFARFNLGILWLAESDLKNAQLMFAAIKTGNLEQESNSNSEIAGDKIVKALQDKAQVALGYYQLSQKKPEAARRNFEKVRLASPQSNKALLGMGWSYLESSAFQSALTHWLELIERDIRDIAVQEALLAVPYAFQKLGSMNEALDYYLSASAHYKQQIDLIDRLNQLIETGGLLEKFIDKIVVSQAKQIDDSGIIDSALFGDEFDYYLYEIISQHRFNEGFRSYQKLGKLANILSYWEQQLPLFDEILKANRIRFDEKLPLVERYLAAGSFERYKNDLAALEKTIEELTQGKNLNRLANKEQLEIVKRVASLSKTAAGIPQNMLSEEQRDKVRRAKGVLQWQLEENKVAKIWQFTKQARQIRAVIDEMESRTESLSKARPNAARRFQDNQHQVDQSRKKLIGLRDKIIDQIKANSQELKLQINSVLSKRRATLSHYLLQADLSIARLHEQAIELPELD